MNDYPPKLVEEIIKNERRYQQDQLCQATSTDEASSDEQSSDEEKPVTMTLNLPYAGDKGEKLVSKVQKYIANTVNKTKKKVSVNAVYTATRIGSKFNIKDKIHFEHQHNVVYHAECPNRKCTSHYTGQTRCRIQKRSSSTMGKTRNHILLSMRKKRSINESASKILKSSVKVIERTSQG